MAENSILVQSLFYQTFSFATDKENLLRDQPTDPII